MGVAHGEPVSVQPAPGRAVDSAARAGSRSLPSAWVRTTLAGAASDPAIETPRDGALRRTGQRLYIPSRAACQGLNSFACQTIVSTPFSLARCLRHDAGLGRPC